MNSPPQRTASLSFALAVGAILAVVAVVILIVRAGDAAHTDAPAGPPLTTIDIVSDPPGATMVRADDGGLIGVAPFTASLPKSDSELPVFVKLEGYQTRWLTVPLFSVMGRIDVKLWRDGVDSGIPASPPDHWIK
jgi:hypothetical protein